MFFSPDFWPPTAIAVNNRAMAGYLNKEILIYGQNDQ